MRDDYQAGFVLPYVLLVIAVLSFSITIAAQRIQNTSKLISKVESRFNTELALSTAEAELVYSFLTSVPASGGVNLNPSNQAQLIINQDYDEIEADIWSAANGTRISETPNGDVIVSYRDLAGYVPLNNSDIQLTESFLKYLGVSSENAKELTAKLKDYTDVDNNRQFRGGERTEYRLRNTPPPTNAPIRQFGEIQSVLMWETFFDEFDIQSVMDTATLSKSFNGMKSRFTNPELARQLELLQPNSDNISNALTGANFPTNAGRFTLTVRATDGGTISRAVEIEKKNGSLYKPFKRFLVYDKLVGTEQTGPEFNKNGLNHVIHAEAYRAK